MATLSVRVLWCAFLAQCFYLYPLSSLPPLWMLSKAISSLCCKPCTFCSANTRQSGQLKDTERSEETTTIWWPHLHAPRGCGPTIFTSCSHELCYIVVILSLFAVLCTIEKIINYILYCFMEGHGCYIIIIVLMIYTGWYIYVCIHFI